MIFADPPYFLSNGGITCHAGKMVSVNKGKWDKSRGVEENHKFILEWLKACQLLGAFPFNSQLHSLVALVQKNLDRKDVTA